MTQYTLVVERRVEGLSGETVDVIGPFDSFAAADEYAKEHMPGMRWTVEELLRPFGR